MKYIFPILFALLLLPSCRDDSRENEIEEINVYSSDIILNPIVDSEIYKNTITNYISQEALDDILNFQQRIRAKTSLEKIETPIAVKSGEVEFKHELLGDTQAVLYKEENSDMEIRTNIKLSATRCLNLENNKANFFHTLIIEYSLYTALWVYLPSITLTTQGEWRTDTNEKTE